MIDDRDPMLQSLFSESQEEIADETFTTQLMLKVDRLARYSRMRRIGAVVVLIVCAWFAAPLLQAAAFAVTRGLSQPIVSVNDGLLTGLFSPVNTYAGAMVLLLLALRTAYRVLISPPQ